MTRYDAEFERQLEAPRRERRLLVVKNIHFKASTTDFKEVCRAKLSKPQTVKFVWQAPNRPWNSHRGFVMLEFDLPSNLRRAEAELEGTVVRNRPVKMERASRKAVSVTHVVCCLYEC